MQPFLEKVLEGYVHGILNTNANITDASGKQQGQSQ